MGYEIEFNHQILSFEAATGQNVWYWRGPTGHDQVALIAEIRAKLETPDQFPPLSRTVVPGDHVTLAVRRDLMAPAIVLQEVVRILVESDVLASQIEIWSGDSPRINCSAWPSEFPIHAHNPDEESTLAYLASTEAGRRVYLNRALTDADVVIPIANIEYDPRRGFEGPWSAIFPWLSDRATQTSIQSNRSSEWDPEDDNSVAATLEEAGEVSWLLGSHFHIGFVPGHQGVAQVIAGEAGYVRMQGVELARKLWTFQPQERSEAVIASVGVADQSVDFDDLDRALRSCLQAVRVGGRIVLLTNLSGPLGPCLQQIMGSVEETDFRSVLRGLENEPDYPMARTLLRARSLCRIYLYSRLDENEVEDLGIVPLAQPQEAIRIFANSKSCTLVNQAERTRILPAVSEIP